MKAIRIHGRGGPEALVYEDAPQPHPAPGEVLVRVHATAIIAGELAWGVTYQTVDGSPNPLPVPGRDLSGSGATFNPPMIDILQNMVIKSIAEGISTP